MDVLKFFKKDNALDKAKADIEAAYKAQVESLQGTPEEIQLQKQMLDDQKAEQLAKLTKATAPAKDGDKVRVDFVAKKFQLNGEVYMADDIEQAAAEGNEEAINLINHLIDIKSGVVKLINE